MLRLLLPDGQCVLLCGERRIISNTNILNGDEVRSSNNGNGPIGAAKHEVEIRITAVPTPEAKGDGSVKTIPSGINTPLLMDEQPSLLRI